MWTVVVFVFTLGLCSILNMYSIMHRSRLERMSMEQLVDEKSSAVVRVLSRLLYKTQALAALVVQNNGSIVDFERVAATIIDDPSIMNILLAPNGIISDVYPMRDNEAAFGFNLFGEGAGNHEAIVARDSGQLVIGGPFRTVQDQEALVGRYPVSLPDKEGQNRFWGLVSVTLKYPEALHGAGLDSLTRHGFAYELWRINPDDGNIQVIAQSDHRYDRDVNYLERPISLFNTKWYFRMLPVRQWYEYPGTWIMLAVSLCLSVVLACIVQNNVDLVRIRKDLENMVRTDALTGLLNREGLFAKLNRLILAEKPFRLCFIDLNGFKLINDTYGHSDGDMLLILFCEKIKSHIDDSFIFARISGDEFILVRTGEYCPNRYSTFWASIDAEFEKPIILSSGDSVTLTFSRGIAHYPTDGASIDDLMTYADKQMYKEKHTRYKKSKGRRATD